MGTQRKDDKHKKKLRELNLQLADLQKKKSSGAGRLRADMTRLQKELDSARARGDKEHLRAVGLQKRVKAQEIDEKLGSQKRTIDQTEDNRALKNSISDLEDQLAAEKERNAIKLEELRAKNELLEQGLLEGRENEMLLRGKLQGTNEETERTLKMENQGFRRDMGVLREKNTESEKLIEDQQRKIYELELKLKSLQSKLSETESADSQ